MFAPCCLIYCTVSWLEWKRTEGSLPYERKESINTLCAALLFPSILYTSSTC
jgi:hypothetical protein